MLLVAMLALSSKRDHSVTPISPLKLSAMRGLDRQRYPLADIPADKLARSTTHSARSTPTTG
jgi:hypothetical protein